MAKAKISKQLTFDMPDSPGLLAGITDALRQANVNVSYLCAYAWDKRAFFMLVTEENAKAKKAVSKLGYKVGEEGIIEVELSNKAGALDEVAKKIAGAGININFIDCTGIGRAAKGFLTTSDDKKAVRAINK